MKLFATIDTIIEKITSWLLVASVFTMLILSVGIIVLRWFETGFMWMDPLVRHLVFACTFLGGIIATGRGTHIGIDILSKYLESENKLHFKRFITILTSLASTATLVWLTMASYDFFKVEMEFGKIEFLGIHSGALVAITPVGLGLLSYRFFYVFLKEIFSKAETAEKSA